MKASEFKRITTALALFASSRETAEAPESLIGVQVSNGVAKLIAGKGPAGVVVTLVGDTPGKFAYTVSARPLLQAAKVITAKQEVEIKVTESHAEITTSDGGSVHLARDGSLSEAGFPRKPKEFVVESQVRGEQFGQLASVFDAIHGDYEIEAPSLQQIGDESHFVCVTPVKDKRALYGHLTVAGKGENEYFAAAYPVFWRSLKALDADGVIRWGNEGVMAVSGAVELYTTPYRVSPYDPKTRRSETPRPPEPWPIMALAGAPSVGLTVDKKAMIEAVKGVMPNDEHGRIVVEVKPDGLVNLSAFGTDKGIQIPGQTVHKGHRACDSALLLKALRAIDGKTATIGWAQQPAMIISAPEMAGWTILLAPVALSAGD